jgi:hypothetical protein
MRVIRVVPDTTTIASFAALVRRQSVFAVSEICKGMLIFGVGDMATADQFGEAVVMIWQAVGFYGSSRAARD